MCRFREDGERQLISPAKTTGAGAATGDAVPRTSPAVPAPAPTGTPCGAAPPQWPRSRPSRPAPTRRPCRAHAGYLARASPGSRPAGRAPATPRGIGHIHTRQRTYPLVPLWEPWQTRFGAANAHDRLSRRVGGRGESARTDLNRCRNLERAVSLSGSRGEGGRYAGAGRRWCPGRSLARLPQATGFVYKHLILPMRAPRRTPNRMVRLQHREAPPGARRPDARRGAPGEATTKVAASTDMCGAPGVVPGE